MPWQRYVMDVTQELDDDGLPAYHTVILVVMRQNGKTELLLPLMTHRATGWGDSQRILYTTQTASKAREKWQDIHVKRLQESPLAPMFTTRLRLNQEAMMWANGSMWSPGSATAKTGGTGDTLNLGVIDEAWSRPDNRTEVGMRPAMLTQQNRQLWVCSMVPGASRASGIDSMYLRQKMAVGRRLVEQSASSGIAYFEWSAEEGLDPADPATWWSCMPALGTREQVNRRERTITEANVRADFESMDFTDFCAEYLGWWPQDKKPMWRFIRETTWENLRDETSQIEGRLSFGVDISPDRKNAAIGVAGKRADGQWHVEVIEPGGRIPADVDDLDWLIPRLKELIDTYNPLSVCIDAKSPGRSLFTPLSTWMEKQHPNTPIDTPNGLEIAAACSRFFDATGQVVVSHPKFGEQPGGGGGENAIRVHHINQRSLNAAVAVASKMTSPTNGTFVYARTGGAGNLTPLYAVTLAMHGYELNAVNDYNILASVY
jgi:hypothetical protein